jgi:hypothetical protein
MVQGAFSITHSNASLGAAAATITDAYSGTGSARTRLRYTWSLLLFGTVTKSLVPGSNGNLNDVFSAQIGNRTWTFSGQYQRNSGYFLFVNSGISLPVATTVAGVRPLYSTSQGFSASASYSRRRLILLASYSHTGGTFDTITVPTDTTNSYLEARAYYKFRKLDFQAGFRRLTQSASINNALNQTSRGYWVSVVRQFHAF